MKPPPFEYHHPRTLQQALQHLSDFENARLLAGGQSLMPMLNMRLAMPEHLIDLAGVGDLAYILEASSEIAIGAMTTQRTIEFSDLIRRRLPLLSEAILSVGHRQTRNRGTIGGSLCHLDPSAELPLVAMALDATIRVTAAGGTRSIPMAEFAVDFMTPAIEGNEIVTEIRFQPWPEGHGAAFLEFARRKGDFAVVAVAVMLQLAPDGRIARASLAVGGVGPVPVRVKEAEAILVGSAPRCRRIRPRRRALRCDRAADGSARSAVVSPQSGIDARAAGTRDRLRTGAADAEWLIAASHRLPCTSTGSNT
ncbi:MAG: FAD binding domain-containing protein [Vicinamibacterales bacterium]